MNHIILAVMIFLASYVLLKNRKLDYFSVLSLSTIFYYFPAILGEVRLHTFDSTTTPLGSEVYIVILVFILILFAFIITNDHIVFTVQQRRLGVGNLENKVKGEDNFSNYSVFFIEILGLGLLVYTYLKYGDITGQFNKMQLLEEADRFTEYFKYIALYCFVYSFINDGQWSGLLKSLSLVLIGYTFLLGHRSFVVIGIIGILMSRFGMKEKKPLIHLFRKNKFISIFAIIGTMFFIFIKGVFNAIITGQFEIVKNRLMNPDYYINTLLISEPNTITSNLYYVVRFNMKFGLDEYILGFFQLIPGVGGKLSSTFAITTFERQLNLMFNNQLDKGVGLASTFLGESYSIAGVVSELIIVLLVIFIIIWCVKQQYSTKNNLVSAYFSVILPYFTFYIHRNSFIFLLVTARAYLYILIFTLTFRGIIKSIFYRKGQL